MMIFFFYFNQVIYLSSQFQAPSSNSFRDSLLTRIHSNFFQRGITPEREITRTIEQKKIIQLSYFSMRNPYMKFQNPSMHGS